MESRDQEVDLSPSQGRNLLMMMKQTWYEVVERLCFTESNELQGRMNIIGQMLILDSFFHFSGINGVATETTLKKLRQTSL